MDWATADCWQLDFSWRRWPTIFFKKYFAFHHSCVLLYKTLGPSIVLNDHGIRYLTLVKLKKENTFRAEINREAYVKKSCHSFFSVCQLYLTIKNHFENYKRHEEAWKKHERWCHGSVHTSVCAHTVDSSCDIKWACCYSRLLCSRPCTTQLVPPSCSVIGLMMMNSSLCYSSNHSITAQI